MGDCRGHNHYKHQLRYDCPECSAEKNMPEGDGKGNLEVNYVYNSYNCWACGSTNGTHGTVLDLIKRYGSKGDLGSYYFINPTFMDYKNKQKVYKTKRSHNLPEGIVKVKKDNSKTLEAYNYLISRGVTDDIIDNYSIYYGITGEYFGRVIIPSYDKFKRINYFVGRSIKSFHKIKYKNPDTPKETILFNQGKIDTKKIISLVEGPFDHIVTPNSLPLLGKVLYDKLFEFLYDSNPPAIFIILDEDAIKNAELIYHMLNSGKLKNKIFIVPLPIGYDPSLFVQHFGVETYHKHIKNNVQRITDMRIWE